ncbi:Molybdopterin biosynthesis MoaE [Cryphonectria parasitica EP155]|uniref:Molybdopterin synthase catalytic subunit n=1 Tax=Cryphonectria parasitica (strain ATCC 38755 / EP155) TaxID=660469 RepID=A0A9P4Y1Z4_CRYP1|nr:Molybdopterin biosynthesis MoaE [Cryphonectria parasitica EP155]KAF3765029.1 Molybdopterin biosynthesis MoaE [Cryphonectria parasitica EP155]
MTTENADTTSERHEPGIYVALTRNVLDPKSIMDRVRSPEAGAIVLFAGTTRDTFGARPVFDLTYQSYVPLALTTLNSIASSIRQKHSLKAIAVVHRLGPVPIGEESILIAVSSPHRQAAWRAGEECLEEVKARAEIWKLERFVGDEEGGVWRANRDGVLGEWVPPAGSSGVVEGKEEQKVVPETMGPVIRARRPGERGHGPVVNPKPHVPPGA